MKNIPALIIVFIFFSCARATERSFTGSTPAGITIRNFLGVPESDSVDFIRWTISIGDDEYSLKCNYGIGKPNTNGFYNGGKWINLEGPAQENDKYIWLHYKDRVLGLAILNGAVLHFVDENRSLVKGNAGWSYTLNRIGAKEMEAISFNVKTVSIKDSMIFEGRTACIKFAQLKDLSNCYKLKWSLVLYANTESNRPLKYKLRGTVVDHKTVFGTGTVKPGAEGTGVYSLEFPGNQKLYFVLLDHILLFTDATGKLLVGNEDFSFTLSRKG